MTCEFGEAVMPICCLSIIEGCLIENESYQSASALRTPNPVQSKCKSHKIELTSKQKSIILHAREGMQDGHYCPDSFRLLKWLLGMRAVPLRLRVTIWQFILKRALCCSLRDNLQYQRLGREIT